MSRKTRCIVLLLATVLAFTSLCGFSTDGAKEPGQIVVGIAWRTDTDSEFYTNVTCALEALGVEYKLLPQVKHSQITYNADQVDAGSISEHDYIVQSAADLVKSATAEDSNVKDAVAGIDGVIFTGGEDISPTLYKEPVAWHGISEEQDYNAARDISDYLLLSYCIDQDIPVIGFCRGMQMLGVVCGATVIQDIPTYYEEQGIVYDYTHRNNKVNPDDYRDYAAHNVMVTDKNSVLYNIAGADELLNAASWHHQAVRSVEGTDLKVTGKTTSCGIDLIEALEMENRTFIMGVQFHPEASIAKCLKNAQNKENYMDSETAFKFFDAFISACA